MEVMLWGDVFSSWFPNSSPPFNVAIWTVSLDTCITASAWKDSGPRDVQLTVGETSVCYVDDIWVGGCARYCGLSG